MMRIREFRRKAKMTQRELGSRIGVTRQYISELERETHIPSLLLAVQISVALGVCIGRLIDYNDCNIKASS